MPKRASYYHAIYLEKVVNVVDRKETVARLVFAITDAVSDGLPVDAIVCTGVSGMLVAPIVSYLTDIPLTVVRKGNDSHSMYEVEGVLPESYIIIDDLVASGSTLKRIQAKMDSVCNAVCVGVITYSSECGYTESFVLKSFDYTLGGAR